MTSRAPKPEELWPRAFAAMKAQGAIRFETEGKHLGCWVTVSEYAQPVLVRADGTVTKAALEIARRRWKQGLVSMEDQNVADL